MNFNIKFMVICLISILTVNLVSCNSNNLHEPKNKSTIKVIKTKDLFNNIVLSEDHPVFYGSIKNAKDYAKKISKRYIAVNGKYSEHTVLFVQGNDDIITNIEIYPKHLRQNITEKDAIDIINKYLPKDILDEYYGNPKYEAYTSENSSNNTYKVINYNLTKSLSNYKYQGQVTVQIEENKEGVVGIYFGFGEPRWMFSPGINGYTCSEWHVDQSIN